MQKQLKELTVSGKTLKNDLETERQRGKEILHENEVLRAKFGVVEENNKKLQAFNEDLGERENGFKTKVARKTEN